MGFIHYLLKILTFPGAFLKAFLEQLACRMYGVPVEFSRYFQKNELCGHVEHLLAPKKGSFGICFLPHIIMLLCGLAFSVPSAMNIVYLGKFNIFGILFLWLGISCFLNCFPLIEDALNMWENLYGKKSSEDESEADSTETKSKTGASSLSKILLAPFAAVMYLGAYAEHYFITVLTTCGFFYAIPYILAWFIK